MTIRLKRCPVGEICSNNAHFSPRMLHLLGCMRDFSASGFEMTYETLLIELGLLDFTALNAPNIFIPDPGGRVAGVRLRRDHIPDPFIDPAGFDGIIIP